MKHHCNDTSGFGWPYTPCPHDSGLLLEDVYPTLFYGAETLPEMRRKVQRLPWAADVLTQLVAEAEIVLRQPPQLPVGVTSWRHSFYGPDTGGPLLFDENSPSSFEDPGTGARVTGEEIGGAWRQLAHERTYRLMRSMAVLFRLTGDERFAEWAVQGLVGAAMMFARDELRNTRFSSALYNQPLYDAQILSIAALTYGMVEDTAAMGARGVREPILGMFGSQIPHLLRALEAGGINNTSAYIALAIALIGEARGDESLILRGLHSERTGLEAHLRDGVPTRNGVRDGFWFEGTLFYHLYTIFPLIGLRQVAQRRGADTGDHDAVLHAMLSVVLKLCDDQGRLYCLGDFGAPRTSKLVIYRHLLEYAHGWLGCLEFEPVLAAMYARGPRRNSFAALAYGGDALALNQRPAGSPAGVDCLGAAQIARLTASDAAGPFALWFKCGPYGGGHDHLDALAIGLHARGEIVTTDLGSPGYGLTHIREFYKSTLSHNTLMVDEQPQNRARDAELLSSHPEYCQIGGVVRDAYEGVNLKRVVRLAPPLVYLEDTCESEEEHRYSWVFHAYGSLSAAVSGLCEAGRIQPLPQSDGFYWCVSHRSTEWTDGFFRADWQVGECLWLRALVSTGGPMECTTGRSPGNPLPDDRGTVIMRTRARRSVFRTILEVHTGWPGQSRLDYGDKRVWAGMGDQ
jgi:oligo-alginate lyase